MAQSEHEGKKLLYVKEYCTFKDISVLPVGQANIEALKSKASYQKVW